MLPTDLSAATILIYISVELVFCTERWRKFILPAERGTGCFVKIGLPVPAFLGSLVGSGKSVCGLLARLASAPFILIMLGTIATAESRVLVSGGFWELLHSNCSDWAMLPGSIFLLVESGGRWSMDRLLVTFDQR